MKKRYYIRDGSIAAVVLASVPFIALILMASLLTAITGTH